MELRGLPHPVGTPPFSRRFATVGTLSGTLRGLSRPARSVSRFGVCRRSDLPVHFLIALFYAGGGGGTPALRRAFLRAKHGRRPPGEAVDCRRPSFFTSFLHSFSFFLDFLHFRHIHVFTCDTPGFLRFFGFFCSVFGVCDTPWFWLVFNVSRLFCVDGSSITQCMIY